MFLQLIPHSNHLGVLLKQKLPESDSIVLLCGLRTCISISFPGAFAACLRSQCENHRPTLMRDTSNHTKVELGLQELTDFPCTILEEGNLRHPPPKKDILPTYTG